jgi:hypothetical protein
VISECKVLASAFASAIAAVVANSEVKMTLMGLVISGLAIVSFDSQSSLVPAS